MFYRDCLREIISHVFNEIINHVLREIITLLGFRCLYVKYFEFYYGVRCGDSNDLL